MPEQVMARELAPGRTEGTAKLTRGMNTVDCVQPAEEATVPSSDRQLWGYR